MKYNELDKKSAAELRVQEKQLREELFQLRLKGATAQLEDKSKIRSSRRDIARVQTKLSQLKSQKA